MSAHTPGPWRFDHDWRRLPTVFGSDGNKVATIEKDRAFDGFVYELEAREANARLIAAAPDMLAALQEIARQNLTEEMCEERHDGADFEGAYDAIIKIAREALPASSAETPLSGKNQ